MEVALGPLSGTAEPTLPVKANFGKFQTNGKGKSFQLLKLVCAC